MSHAEEIAVSGGSEPAGGASAGADPKAWARERMKGLETFVFPSFTPDLKTLDEAGIRRDVRHAIDQGFVGAMPSPVGVSAAESARLTEIVADEAKGRLLTSIAIQTKAGASQEGAVRRAEALGYTHAIILTDPTLPTQDAIYQRMRDLITRTSLAIVLYASPNRLLTHLDPTGLPLDAYDRLADLPNVVAIKLTQIIPDETALTVADRLGDRLLIGPVNFEQVPALTSARRGIQWSGQWCVDGLQSPQQPLAVRFMQLLSAGQADEARAVYERLGPVARAFYAAQDPYLRVGGHPWLHLKYYQWLTGGNGGLIRDLAQPADHMPILDAESRRRCRDAFAAAGIETVDLPDEAFLVGAEAYGRGARARDLATMPQYAA